MKKTIGIKLLLVALLFLCGCSQDVVIAKFKTGDFARVKLDGRKCAILYVFLSQPPNYKVRVSQINESTAFLGGDVSKEIYSVEYFEEWELESL